MYMKTIESCIYMSIHMCIFVYWRIVCFIIEDSQGSRLPERDRESGDRLSHRTRTMLVEGETDCNGGIYTLIGGICTNIVFISVCRMTFCKNIFEYWDVCTCSFMWFAVTSCVYCYCVLLFIAWLSMFSAKLKALCACTCDMYMYVLLCKQITHNTGTHGDKVWQEVGGVWARLWRSIQKR